ncbi:MAG: tetratricopeptide repeat protein [Desulfatiglandaceae bacterium]
MDAVTYPTQDVIEHIEKYSIPVRIPFDAPLAREFVVKWTPNLLFVDAERALHHRIIGFLPPEELNPAILLGVGKIFLDHGDFDRALGTLNEVLEKHPGSHAAPEAVYFRGVSQYKQTHSGEPLKKAYEKLKAAYPESEWAKRAAPYRLL